MACFVILLILVSVVVFIFIDVGGVKLKWASLLVIILFLKVFFGEAVMGSWLLMVWVLNRVLVARCCIIGLFL